MQRLSNSEIDSIERKLGVSLPGLYRKLLVEVGYGSFANTANAASPWIEILHPETIRERYDAFFSNTAVLFAPYFPFGHDEQKQEIWVIDATEEKAASIWHETNDEDWAEEEWLSYEDWIKEYFD